MQQQKDTINDQLCKQLSEKMVLDMATRLVNDANARQYLNPESNDFNLVQLDLPLMWQTRHLKEQVTARLQPCPFVGFPATRRIIHW
jgi:hypothetical protein